MPLALKSSKYASSTFRPRDVLPAAPAPHTRQTVRPPSLHGGVDRAWAPARPAPQYTGDACLGVATMHKSNLVPIFNAEAAVDAARMRRG